MTHPIGDIFILMGIVFGSYLSAQGQGDETSLQQYTPSALFGRGQWELKHFSNVYVQTKAFDDPLRKSDDRSPGRQVYATIIHQFLYGINRQLNIGADVWLKHVSVTDLPRTARRTGLTGIGPKIKITPFKKLARLSLQSTLLLPVTGDLESRTPEAANPGLFLEHDRVLWLNEFFFDRFLSSDFQLFFRGSVWTSIPRDSFRDRAFVETPISVFLNHFATPRWTIYVQSEAWLKHTEDRFRADGSNPNVFKPFSSFFLQSGLGAKYQVIPGLLEAELLYTNFWLGSQGEGAGQTFNFGLRVIR